MKEHREAEMLEELLLDYAILDRFKAERHPAATVDGDDDLFAEEE